MSPASTPTALLSPDPVLTLPAVPALSLGAGVFEWCQEYVRQPDGPNAGEGWQFTSEQIRYLHYLYAVDERGRFLWSRSVLRRAKGWGKTPVMAAIALAELCGPVRFDGWNAKGEPVGRPVSMAWVQIAGVSEKQTTNTMSMVLAMIAESPVMDEYGLDPGLTRVFTAAGGRLEPITASAPTAEGARPTFCVLDETHHWLKANGGHKLAEVIRRNLGKSRDGMARSVETTNAHEQGMDSVAERSLDAWQAQVTGRAKGSTILYDSREAPPDVDLSDDAALLGGLAAAYGDSTWVDHERIRDEIRDFSTPPGESRRFYLNQLAALEDSWVSPQHVDAAGRDDAALTGELTLFFDGSKSDDATGLVGCRMSDGHLLTLGVWQKPDGPRGDGWVVDRFDVDLKVREILRTGQVVGFYADPSHAKDDDATGYWDGIIDGWHRDFGVKLKHWSVRSGDRKHSIMWDMSSSERVHLFTEAAMQFTAELEAGVVTHDDHPALKQHMKNALRAPNKYGVSLQKPHRESLRKVDLAVCAVGARMLRRVLLNRPSEEKRSGLVVGIR